MPGLESLIRTINKLQDAFTLLGHDPLSLPQICVVGAQSSGKSSVLENVVGRDFLPRGSGIVTRRPLIIQLINDSDEYGEFLHKPNQRFGNFSDIRREIESATDLETGTNKGISDKPINLKIFSPKVVNLTLVDLPGITRVPVGDQPPDIEQLIRKMVIKFIKQPNAIILAVTPANSDLANSDALQLAREFDPQGLRTVGVITKLDIMDRGTDAMDVLEGKVVPLRLGYVGVINRAQADIDEGKKIEKQWDAEKQFFETHPVYSRISERCGTPYLTQTLSKTLIGHIKTCLPEIVTKISALLNEKKSEMGDLAVLDEPREKQRAVLRSITSYCDNFRQSLEGSGLELHGRLYGGAKISQIFRESFAQQMDETDFLEKLSDDELKTTMKNALGLRDGLFIPDHSFEVLIREAVRELEAPARACVQMVHEELISIAMGIMTPEMRRFPAFLSQMQDSMRELLQHCLDPTLQLVTTLINMETARINTLHPEFLGAKVSMTELMSDVAHGVGHVRRNTISKPKPPTRARARTGKLQPTRDRAPPPPPESQDKAGEDDQATEDKPKEEEQSPSLSRHPAVKAEAVTLTREQIEIETIRRLLFSYFDIVKIKLVDSVPKAVLLSMVQGVLSNMHEALVSEMYQESKIEALLKEDESSVLRRKKCQEIIKLMQESLKTIAEVQTVITS